jgi:hypothetical protein
MRASFILKNCWSNTTDHLRGRRPKARSRVMFVLLSLSLYSLIGADRVIGRPMTWGERETMCHADGNRTENACIAANCEGVETLACLRTCERLGQGRHDGCIAANADIESSQPSRKKNPIHIAPSLRPPMSDPSIRRPQPIPPLIIQPESNPKPLRPALR